MPDPERVAAILQAHEAGEHIHRALAKLISAGVEPDEAQRLLGGKVDTTQRLYRDVEPMDRAEAAQVLAVIARDPVGKPHHRIAAVKQLSELEGWGPVTDDAGKRKRGITPETIEQFKRQVLGMPKPQETLH